MEKRKPHFFIAIPILYEVKEWLSSYVSSIRGEMPFKKWVHEEDYHITLTFLGYVEDEKLQVLNKKIIETLEQMQSFSLAPTTVGVFGQIDSPRILWVGVEVNEELLFLQRNIARVCEKVGIELDQRPYRPHITIARKWSGEDKFSISKAQSSLEKLTRPSQLEVNKVILYQSHIGKTPMYESKVTYDID